MGDFIPFGPDSSSSRGPGRQGGGGGRGWSHSGDRRGGDGGGRSWRGRGGGFGGGGRGGGRGGRGGGFGRGGGHGRGRGGRQNHHPGQQGGPPRNNYDISNDVIEEIGSPLAENSSVSIAIEGCCHGELDRIYERLQAHEQKTGQTIDLLLCCGDFQSHRNEADFHSSSIPPKYRSLGTFPKYYAGERKAPILTIFIGGNHEASQPLRELYYGGWVAPNIYYLGAAGVVRFGGLRIGGISGIFKSHDYAQGHFEHPPYDHSSLRSVYHVRNVDAYRLKQLAATQGANNSKDRLDIMISHDWPLGIAHHGDTEGLLRRKPYFRAEVQDNTLGSPPNREILDTVQPKWWFAAHLHVKFKATVKHNSEAKSPETTAAKSKNVTSLVPSQISRTTLLSNKEDVKEDSTSNEMNEPPSAENESLETQSIDVKNNNNNTQSEPEPSTTEFLSLEGTSQCAGPDLTDQMTQFLALDKCLPRRHYLSIVHLPSNCPKEEARLEYDAEWLAILRKTHHLTISEHRRVHVPKEGVEYTVADVEWVQNQLLSAASATATTTNASTESAPNLTIPNNFYPTIPFYSHPMFRGGRSTPLARMGNPQTDQLLKLLQLDHILTIPYSRDQSEAIIPFHLRESATVAVEQQPDDNEIDIDIDGDENENNDENEIDVDIDGGLDDTKEEKEQADDNEIDIDGSEHENEEERAIESGTLVTKEDSHGANSPEANINAASSEAAVKKARLD